MRAKVILFNIEEWVNGLRVSQISKGIYHCFIIEVYPGAYKVFLRDVLKQGLSSQITLDGCDPYLTVALPGIRCSHIIKQAFFLC